MVVAVLGAVCAVQIEYDVYVAFVALVDKTVESGEFGKFPLCVFEIEIRKRQPDRVESQFFYVVEVIFSPKGSFVYIGQFFGALVAETASERFQHRNVVRNADARFGA